MPLASDNWLLWRLSLWIPLVLSLSVHEWAHAWSAHRLGDDTARRLGRLTVNPLAHVDPIGTVLLPLLGVPFGWAKPVPINPVRFSRRVSMRLGVMLTAAAGPLSNLCIAVAATLLLGLLGRFQPRLLVEVAGLGPLLHLTVVLNLILALFNLLPVPPLDGSLIVDSVVPERLRPAWDAYRQLGPFALAAVILIPALLGASLLAWPLERAQLLLEGMLALLSGSG